MRRTPPLNDMIPQPTADLNRRDFLARAGLVGAGLMGAGLAIAPWGSAAAAPRRATTTTQEGTMQSVRFENGPIMLAGNVYQPPRFDATRTYGAIVVVHPGGGVKEQTAGLYAEQLAAQGFVTLAFDASHQGESGGEPRLLESPQARVEDVRAAVDTGASVRKGWDGTAPASAQIATLDAVAAQRAAEARGAAPQYVEYVPELVDGTTHRDMREAHDYYRTGANMHPNSPNKMLFTSLDKMLAFTGFDQVETLLTQPLLVIAGSKAGSLWHSRELHAKAAAQQKEFVLIDGATHMDLYAGAHVSQVVAKLTPFYERHV